MMNGAGSGGSWMMWGMGLGGLLVVGIVVLGIVALAMYLVAQNRR